MTDYMIFNTLLVIFCPKYLEISGKSIIFAAEKESGQRIFTQPHYLCSGKKEKLSFF